MDKKVYTPTKDKRLPHKIDLSRANRIPWTEKQKQLIDLLTLKQKFSSDEQLESEECLIPVDTKCAFISGVAGTSKTLTSVYSALKLLDTGKIETIYYVRSAVGSSSNKVGFLKGSLEDKLSVYQTPLNDKLQELLPEMHIKTLLDGGFVVMESTDFLRGRNLANCVVLIDEAQNLDHHELVTIISRMAEKGRIWFCFDPDQSDLKNNHKDDMVNFAEIFNPEADFENKKHGFIKFEFSHDDIVRSEFCKYVMKKLKGYNKHITT